MDWEQEDLLEHLPIRAVRRMPDQRVGPGKKLRHPAVQAEIERRVAIYARQVEEHGCFTWLPFRGEGHSA
jgi:hypothetical protein